MVASRDSFSLTFWAWIISVYIFKLAQGTVYQLLEDDQISYGSVMLINSESMYQGTTEETIPISQSVQPQTIFSDPQIFIAIMGMEVKSESMTGSVYWTLSCAPTSTVNDFYQFVIAKNQIQFYLLIASYLIYEKDINRKVVNGQTNFQQLIDQQQPANNILRISMPFPNKQGYIKFSTVFITGVKLTVAVADLSIQMNAKTELFSDHYDIIFDMFDSSLKYTVDLIYWNVLEYYQLSDESFASADHVDGPIGNSHASSETIYQPFGTFNYSLYGLFIGLQILFSRSVTLGQQAGLQIDAISVSSNLNIRGICNADTEVLNVGIQTFKILLLTCPSQVYDVIIGDCADSCSDGYYMHQVRLNRKACLQCDTTCKTCSDYGDTNCTSCQDNQQLIEGQCKSNTNNKESILSEETIQTISDSCSNISQASTIASATLTFTSGFLMVSGSPLLSQLLTTQKAFYLLLININPPKFLFSFVSSLSDNGILKQFSSFNALPKIVSDSSESNTIGGQFETQKIPSNIFLNAGGGLTIITALGSLFALFVVLENSRLHKIGMLLYEKMACGIIVETFQVSIFIFTFSTCICITNSSEIDTVQLIVILACTSLVIFILTGQTLLLWKKSDINPSDFSQSVVKRALIKKLLNECKNENIYSRLYMVAFLMIECFLFPLIIVIARENAIAASFSLAAVQLLETGMTFFIRPFEKMRETILLVVEQMIFSGILTSFAILTLLLEKVEDSSPTYPTSVNTLSLIISVLIAAAVLLKPFAQLFRIIITLKDLMNARMKKSQQGTLEEKENNVENSTPNKVQIYPSGIEETRQKQLFISQYFKSPIKFESPSPDFRESSILINKLKHYESSHDQLIKSL